MYRSVPTGSGSSRQELAKRGYAATLARIDDRQHRGKVESFDPGLDVGERAVDPVRHREHLFADPERERPLTDPARLEPPPVIDPVLRRRRVERREAMVTKTGRRDAGKRAECLLTAPTMCPREARGAEGSDRVRLIALPSRYRRVKSIHPTQT